MINNFQLQIYEKIRAWETDHGESLLDQGFNLNELTFMTWCFGKGYLTRHQYNQWVENMNTLEGCDANYYVYNSYGEDVPWAVVSSDEWNEEDGQKAYLILAEFISEIDAYYERLEKFIKGEDEE